MTHIRREHDRMRNGKLETVKEHLVNSEKINTDLFDEMIINTKIISENEIETFKLKTKTLEQQLELSKNLKDTQLLTELFKLAVNWDVRVNVIKNEYCDRELVEKSKNSMNTQLMEAAEEVLKFKLVWKTVKLDTTEQERANLIEETAILGMGSKKDLQDFYDGVDSGRIKKFEPKRK